MIDYDFENSVNKMNMNATGIVCVNGYVNESGSVGIGNASKTLNVIDWK
jgi:hypothetical protein